MFRTLRRGLLWLAGLTTAGIGVELAVERHWTQPGQFIAWGALALLLIAIALVGRGPSARRVRIARSLAALVVLTSAVGVWQHVASNYDAGPLDFRYTNIWDSLPEVSRWWLAVSKTVGASPPLAPGALAQAALAVLLATVGHPALGPGAARRTRFSPEAVPVDGVIVQGHARHLVGAAAATESVAHQVVEDTRQHGL